MMDSNDWLLSVVICCCCEHKHAQVSCSYIHILLYTYIYYILYTDYIPRNIIIPQIIWFRFTLYLFTWHFSILFYSFYVNMAIKHFPPTTGSSYPIVQKDANATFVHSFLKGAIYNSVRHASYLYTLPCRTAHFSSAFLQH